MLSCATKTIGNNLNFDFLVNTFSSFCVVLFVSVNAIF